MVCRGITVMLRKGASKVVTSIHLGTSAEVEVVVLLVVDNTLDSRHVGHSNWRGRQTQIHICIIWRIDTLMLVEYALDGWVSRKDTSMWDRPEVAYRTPNG